MTRGNSTHGGETMTKKIEWFDDVALVVMVSGICVLMLLLVTLIAVMIGYRACQFGKCINTESKCPIQTTAPTEERDNG